MTDRNNRALDGIRVLDLTHTVSGPLCTRILADLGAEVVKLEPPTGDQVRPFPPVVEGESAFFHHFDAGKLGACVDIRTEAGAALVARLAEQADVLVENWRPGALGRRGLGPEQLLARNPRLVYCSISGWGQDGPWAQRRAYAPLVHAEVGTVELSARMRGGEPAQEVLQQADVHGGLAAATAILSALLLRERTGTGQHLDCSLAEAHLYVNEQLAIDLLGWTGMRMMDSWNFPVVTLGDGRMACFVSNPVRGFLQWAEALGGGDLSGDPRFATAEARAGHRDEMLAVLRELAARIPSFAELEQRCEPAGLFACEVRSVQELAQLPWARERGVFTEPVPGVRVPSALFRGSGADTTLTQRAPRLGEHTRPVLARWLGSDDEELAALEEAGILGPAGG